MPVEQLAKVWNELWAASRFKWPAFMVAAAICSLGWLAVLALPDQYQSSARIYVTSDSILKPLLQGIAVSTDTESAADVVRRVLLARPNLERVAKENGLLARARTPQDIESVYLALQKNITIAGGGNQLSIYTVGYTGGKAEVAQSVVKTLIDTFVEDSVDKGRADTANAQKFLIQEVARYKAQLEDSERKLAEFKKQYIGLMPDERGDYFSRMQVEQAALDSRQSEYNVAVKQRDELRRKLIGTGGDGKLPTMPTDAQIQKATELDGQLQDVRKQLEAALLDYTDKHPKVIALRDTISRLEQRRQSELGSVRATSPGGSNTGSAGVDAVMQSLQVQLNTADVQVVSLGAQVGEARRRVAELRRLLTIGPEVEAKLADLNRDYAGTKQTYDSLQQRLESARISENADQSKDVKFRVMDPPRVPPQPTAPMRAVLVLIVLLVGLAGGSAMAYLFSMLKPVFVDAASLAERLQVNVLGSTSVLRSAAEGAAKFRGRLRFAVASGTLLVVAIALAEFSHPVSLMVRSALKMS